MKPFIKFSLGLMAAKAVVNKKTGEMLVFKDADKTLYSWMYAQYTHLRSQDKEFFHNQSFISAATFKSVSTVEKFVRRFVFQRKQQQPDGCGSLFLFFSLKLLMLVAHSLCLYTI
jgi:hypothetical protein